MESLLLSADIVTWETTVQDAFKYPTASVTAYFLTHAHSGVVVPAVSV